MKTDGKVTGIIVSLASLAVSGIALADHSPGHGKKKEKETGPPATKTSVEVTNLCEPTGSYDDPDKGTIYGSFLKVTSTIRNDSGDGIDDPLQIGEEATVSQVQVGGLQLVKDEKPAKKEWKPVGDVEFIPNAELTINPGESQDYVVYLDLCSPAAPAHKLDANATALNAEVQIMIKEGSAETVRNFIGNCDDLDPYDDKDESRIDLEDYPDLGC